MEETSIELVQGPVQKWEPGPKDAATIDRLLSSSKELDRAYGEAYLAGCFITEFSGIAAVGEMDTLAVAEFRMGIEIDPKQLTIGDCIAFGAFPGGGATRAECVRDGLSQVLSAREEKKDPHQLDLYGSFTEKGYKIDAFMPSNSKQTTQWTIRVYKEGDEEIYSEVTVPMMHAPVFGVDVDDIAELESRVDQLLQELTDQQL